MDADDVSCPDRLEAQMALLQRNPDIVVVASLSDMIDQTGRKMREPDYWRLTRRSAYVPFAHSAMMYRRELFDRVGGYREACEYWEDQDLVLRMAALADIVVIPQTLVRVRQSTTRTRLVCAQDHLERALEAVYGAMDQFRNAKDYSADADQIPMATARLDPRVFISLGSVQLWAGRRPHLFRRLLKRADLSLNVPSAAALVWTAWASASPSSLRGVLNLVLRARNMLALRQISLERPVIWRPLKPITAVGKREEPA
jgi:hypothetical protein